MTKIALVTGAGSGIGRAVSLALDSAGYSVVLAGRRAAELDKTAAQGRGKLLPVPTDISTRSPRSVPSRGLGCRHRRRCSAKTMAKPGASYRLVKRIAVQGAPTIEIYQRQHSIRH